MSSIIIPKPPLNFFSSRSMGKGFHISKMRNKINANVKSILVIEIPVPGKLPIRVNSIKNPTISSITIQDGSFIANA